MALDAIAAFVKVVLHVAAARFPVAHARARPSHLDFDARRGNPTASADMQAPARVAAPTRRRETMPR